MRFSGGWDAVSEWADAQRDVALSAYAQSRLVRQGSTLRHRAVTVAERLAGGGELGAARMLAGAIVDAGDAPLSDVDAALVGRLAVDDAVARRENALARVRATRARMGLEEVAARALIAGKPDIARSLALERIEAEPGSLGARLVLAGVDGNDLSAVGESVGEAVGETVDPTQSTVSAAAFVAFGAALARAIPEAQAKAALDRIAHGNPSSGDDLVVREATDLVARRVMPAQSLPVDGLVELAARYGISPPASWEKAPLDMRHRYLALALSRPAARETEALGESLGVPNVSDPIVVAAAACVALGTRLVIPAADARTLLDRSDADPLLVALARRLAEKSGDSATAAKARAAVVW